LGGKTDSELALDILQSTGVATIAGSAFHMAGYLRLSYGANRGELETAFDRLEAYFN